MEESCLLEHCRVDMPSFNTGNLNKQNKVFNFGLFLIGITKDYFNHVLKLFDMFSGFAKKRKLLKNSFQLS